ncbi:hypothetical protein GOV05_04795 [Candidatus Woesearchaeota archaeon]|nr:hypothetical protein [Candidatus Woesearchaeota archaeon]
MVDESNNKLVNHGNPAIAQKEKRVPSSQKLSVSALKKMIKFLIRANHKIGGGTNLEREIIRIKHKLRKRADQNKELRDKKSQEFFEEKKKERHDELNMSIKNIGGNKKDVVLEAKQVLRSLEEKHSGLKSSPNQDKALLFRVEEKIRLIKDKIKTLEV